MLKKLHMFKIKVLQTDGTYDETFEKRVLKLIDSATLYMDNPYIDEAKSMVYKIISRPERIDNYYFAAIKKSSHMNKTEVNDETEAISTSKISNDHLLRFGINFNTNLITVSTKGDFGFDQFTKAFKYIFKETIIKEFKEDIGIIEILPATGQPVSWNMDNVIEKIKNLNHLKEIEMIINFPLTEQKKDDENEILYPVGLSDRKEIKSRTGFSTGILQMINLGQLFNSYKEEGFDQFIKINCKDMNGQIYRINDQDPLFYEYSGDIIKKENFINKSKDSVENYIEKYLG